MNVFSTLLDQFKKRWDRTNVGGRIAAAAALALAIGTILAIGVWSSRPQYVHLADNLAPSETAEYVSRLDAAGIPNKMNFAGSGVLVPKSKLNKARVAVGELLGPQPEHEGPLDGSIISDPSLNHFRLLQRKEASLEASILRMRAVTSADVHIAQPKWTPFLRNQDTATASIVLGLRPGEIFTQEHAATIVALVSGSVEGLMPDQVTVTDLEGRLLMSQGAFGESGVREQMEIRRIFEAELSTKAETMLAKTLGPDKAIVRVTAEMDFTETETTATTYDSDTKVKLSESITNTTKTGGAATMGPAGTSSNMPGGTLQRSATASPILEKTETIDAKFQPAPKTETTKTVPGKPTRISVAAMVDLSAVASAAPANTAAQPSVTKEQVEALVKTAVGFDAARGDQIEVLVTSLVPPADDLQVQLVADRQWEHIIQLIRNSSLGLAAVSALIIVLVTLRKVKPITIASRNTDEEAQRRERLLAELSRRVHENPETVSRILAAWLGESTQKTEGLSETEPDTIPMRRAA